MTPQQKRDAWRRRKGLHPRSRPDSVIEAEIVGEGQVGLPHRHDPWAPKRSPAFERRLTQHKLTLIKMLGGRIAE